MTDNIMKIIASEYDVRPLISAAARVQNALIRLRQLGELSLSKLSVSVTRQGDDYISVMEPDYRAIISLQSVFASLSVEADHAHRIDPRVKGLQVTVEMLAPNSFSTKIEGIFENL